MNHKMVFHMTGRILQVEACLFVLPILCSLFYGEFSTVKAFLLTAVIAVVSGTLITLLTKPKDKMIFAKDGFAIVSFAWISVSLIGALPFVFTGEIPSYINALFETVSGFTTTGASILTDPSLLSHGSLFWRSFTHWIGGMGVLVFVMAILPNESDRAIHIMRAEVPGPIVGKIVPKIKETAKILYLIYIGMTVFMILLLLCGGLNLFESLIYAFGTAGTGGFGIQATSLVHYSPYIQTVITVFMILFGINFNLYYLILIGKIRSAFKSQEFWCYLGIIALAAGIISVNILPLYATVQDAIGQSVFHVSSVITTTGFLKTNIDLWPPLSKMIILLLMFFGGCAGSTAGGLKIARVMLLFKTAGRDLKKMLHPRSVGVVKLEGKTVDDATTQSTSVYFIVYFILFFALLLLISFEPFGFETTFSAVATCFNNVGPAFGAAASNFADFSAFSKVILSIAMLFGRLEIFPLLLAFHMPKIRRG